MKHTTLPWAAGLILMFLSACGGGGGDAEPDTVGTVPPGGTTLGAAGGTTRSGDDGIRLVFAAGQITGETSVVFTPISTSPSPLLLQLPSALAADYEPVPGASWQIQISGSGWKPGEAIAASIVGAAPTAFPLDPASVRPQAKPLAVPPPATVTTSRRALIQCPNGAVHIVTPEYGDGRDAFVIGCPGLDISVTGTVTVVVVQLINTVPAISTWTRQVGGGALAKLGSSVDGAGRFNMLIRTYTPGAEGNQVGVEQPIRFVSYDSTGALRGNLLWPLPSVIPTPMPSVLRVGPMLSLGNGRHVFHGTFTATPADATQGWVMVVEESLGGATPAAATLALREIWATTFGLPAGPDGFVNGVGVTAAGEVLIAGGISGFGSAIDPRLNLSGPFVAKLSPTGALLWAAPLNLPVSNGQAPAVMRRTAVDRDGNLLALAYAQDNFYRDPAHCGNAASCVRLLKVNGTNGALLWSVDVVPSLVPQGLEMTLDAEGNTSVASFTVLGGPARQGQLLKFSKSGTQLFSASLPGTFAIEATGAMGYSPSGSLGLSYFGTLNFGSSDPTFPEQSGAFFQDFPANGSIRAPRLLAISADRDAQQQGLYDRSGSYYLAGATRVGRVPDSGLNLGCLAAEFCTDVFVTKGR